MRPLCGSQISYSTEKYYTKKEICILIADLDESLGALSIPIRLLPPAMSSNYGCSARAKSCTGPHIPKE